MTDTFEVRRARRRRALDEIFERFQLPLTDAGKGPVAAWFLGPKAENERLLRELVLEALEMHLQARRRFHPGDPQAITARDKRSRDYKDAVKELHRRAKDLFAALQSSAPVWSMRHQGHMLWDQALPAVVGYFGAMLYNQNNVAAEASPLTTRLEIEVGNDLCRLLGFDVPLQDGPADKRKKLASKAGSDVAPNAAGLEPWGHITCDGSVANMEALWAARNAKFLPVALQAALREAPALAGAKELRIKCPRGGMARLVDVDAWALLNLDIDDIVGLPHRLESEFDVCMQTTTDALLPVAVHNIGLIEFYKRYMPEMRPPVAMAPATCHYSWPKAGTLLGLGQNNLLRVRVDLQARMDVGHLRELLQNSLDHHQPVTAVVAVIGSTEESAVDPLCEILRLRDEFRMKGLNFAIHCDAAWGGYFRAMLPDRPRPRAFDEQSLPLSPYVTAQLLAMKDADSVTIDPHKAGYVPYPAGALCYRNSAMRDLISLKAPVVFHNESEPTVGIYGIEGSKPGAAPAAVYLAHKVISPTESGYGKILGQCVWTSTRLYCRLVTMKGRR
ncbi:MAG: pyridoxal-dependent decarboxylase, partial [Pseudomonadota bacterium]